MKKYLLNKSRLLTIVFAILILCSSLSPIAVFSENTITVITFNPSSGIVGSEISIIGQNFAGTLATISWDNKVIVKNIPISANGKFEYIMTIPEGSKGNHTIRVTDNSNWSLSSAESTFLVTPSIRIFPDSLNVDTNLTIYGSGFVSLETGIMVTIDGKTIPGITGNANQSGSWNTVFPITGLTKGRHWINAFGPATTINSTKELPFIVTPWAEVKPASGPVGTQLLIYGWGLVPNEDGMTITWDNEIIKTNIRAELDGRLVIDGSIRTSGFFKYEGEYTETVFVPPSFQGTHKVGVYGSSYTPKGIMPDYNFLVTSSIKLQQTIGDVESLVDLEGMGFAKDEVIKLTYDQIEINPGIPVDNKGSFILQFRVPVSQGNEHIISATGNKGNTAKTKFTTTEPQKTEPPPIKVEPPPVKEEPKIIKLKYVAPSLITPKNEEFIYLFKSVGDVITSAFKYLGNITSYLKGESVNEMALSDISFMWTSTNAINNISYIINFSNNNNFSNMIFEKTIPEKTSLILDKNIKLVAGDYYWRVKVIDNVGLESPWSETAKFTVSSMTGKTSIFSILVLVLTLAALIFLIITIWVNLANRHRY
jgi:hypothetical protein